VADAVLDSSAILAVLLSEPGAESVSSIMSQSLVSVANEAEVITVLIRNGSPPDRAVGLVRDLTYEIVDLDPALARTPGRDALA
jgi:ribonuclease VapC